MIQENIFAPSSLPNSASHLHCLLDTKDQNCACPEEGVSDVFGISALHEHVHLELDLTSLTLKLVG